MAARSFLWRWAQTAGSLLKPAATVAYMRSNRPGGWSLEDQAAGASFDTLGAVWALGEGIWLLVAQVLIPGLTSGLGEQAQNV